MLAQPLDSSEILFSEFSAAVLENQVMKFLTPGSSATTLTWSGAWGRRLLSLMWGPIFLKGTLRWYWWCLSVSLASPWAWGIGSLFFSSPSRV